MQDHAHPSPEPEMLPHPQAQEGLLGSHCSVSQAWGLLGLPSSPRTLFLLFHIPSPCATGLHENWGAIHLEGTHYFTGSVPITDITWDTEERVPCPIYQDRTQTHRGSRQINAWKWGGWVCRFSHDPQIPGSRDNRHGLFLLF